MSGDTDKVAPQDCRGQTVRSEAGEKVLGDLAKGLWAVHECNYHALSSVPSHVLISFEKHCANALMEDLVPTRPM